MVNHTTFSLNWNGKLNCTYFTTVRLLNPKKYEVGSIHEIWLEPKGQPKIQVGKAQVIVHQHRTTETLTDTECYLDAGYDRANLNRMLWNMYKRPVGAVLSLSFVTFKMVERYENK